MSNKSPDIVIIGAGLTGLTMAYYLQKYGKSIVILEKEKKTGGVIHTVSERGFIYESGPNTGVLSTPEIAALFLELNDYCTLETANPKSEKRYILKKGKWQPLPSGLISAISTPLFRLRDKLKILGEPFRKPGTNPDESVAQMVVRRLGRSFLEYAVDPFVSGIYAGDPEKLITRYALPKLYALEHTYGSFIRGTIKKAHEPKTEYEKRATREVFSVKGGLENLIKALTDRIGDESLVMGISDLVIKPADTGYTISYVDDEGKKSQLQAPVVVTTIGGYALPSILPFISEQNLKPFTDLKYASIVQVALGYSEWKGQKPDAFGGLIPSLENRDILGVLFPSAIFEGRSPVNGALLSVFLGGVKKPEMISKTDNEIETIVLREVRAVMSELNLPDLIKIHRYLHAIPQYEVSTGERLEQIRSIQNQYKGLILAGNIRDGIGMADRVKQAMQIAEFLTSRK